MNVGLDNEELAHLGQKLKNGEYDGVDQMHAWIALEELIELRVWRDRVFAACSHVFQIVGEQS